MMVISKLFLFAAIVLSSFFISLSQPCDTLISLSLPNNQRFSSCNNLPVLNASIHWNHYESSNVIDIAYRRSGVVDRGWIAWAINPTSRGMIGSQAIVAFTNTDGVLISYTSPITSYGTQLQSANLSLPVSNVAATLEGSVMVLFATIKLPPNLSTINHLWQEGPLSGNTPLMHTVRRSSPNMRSFGTLDLKSGRIAEAKSGVDSKTKLKYAHGVLNTVSWGILMPTGVVMARYLKTLQPLSSLWFNLHRGCQLLAYVIGIAGWATGIYLGQKSVGVSYKVHRNIGIALFVLSTAQVLVAFARPNKDKKTRPYFNAFHYLVGYSTIAMSIANIFEGFRILSAEDIWRNVYIAVIAILGIAAVFLEVWKWYVYLLQKRTSDVEKGTAATAPELH